MRASICSAMPPRRESAKVPPSEVTMLVPIWREKQFEKKIQLKSSGWLITLITTRRTWGKSFREIGMSCDKNTDLGRVWCVTLLMIWYAKNSRTRLLPAPKNKWNGSLYLGGLVSARHEAGIVVIEWVPAHVPTRSLIYEQYSYSKRTSHLPKLLFVTIFVQTLPVVVVSSTPFSPFPSLSEEVHRSKLVKETENVKWCHYSLFIGNSTIFWINSLVTRLFFKFVGGGVVSNKYRVRESHMTRDK